MRRGDETREALLDAALEAMSERGFHGTSVPELAERAGIGAATIYRHFESKEALANALYLHAKRRFATMLWDEFPEALPVRKAFHEIWVRLARIAAQHTSMLVFLEMHHHVSYISPETMAACEDLATPRIEALLARGQAEGVVRSGDPAFLLAFLEGAFMGLAKAAIGSDGRVDEGLLVRGEGLAWAAVRA